MTQPKALLFDLDGTLVDSVPLWIEANLEILKSLDVMMTAAAFLKEIYHAGLHYEGILEKCGVPMEKSERFYRERDALFADLLRKNVQWTGEAEKTLQVCASHAPLGMMTGSRRCFIDAMDEKLSLSALFKSIVTRDDTGKKMKPDPYGLLILAEHLEVKPAECLYVGDQYVDVQAAKNAHMPVCLLKTKETPDGAGKEADMVITAIETIAKNLGYAKF